MRNLGANAAKKKVPARAKGRRRYHHGDLRSALIAAGRELLAENGPRGFTLRECARRAGVSHAAPAHHFPTAGDLLAEIAATGFDDLTTSMRRFAAEVPLGDEAGHLVALGRGYVAFALTNRAVFQLMFRCDAFSFQNERFATAAGTAFGCLGEAVNALLPNATPSERGLLLDRSWSVVHGFATLVIEGQICKGETDPGAIDRRLAAILESELGGERPPRRAGGRDVQTLEREL
jgi:AcrR family transcriptional regulator